MLVLIFPTYYKYDSYFFTGNFQGNYQHNTIFVNCLWILQYSTFWSRDDIEGVLWLLHAMVAGVPEIWWIVYNQRIPHLTQNCFPLQTATLLLVYEEHQVKYTPKISELVLFQQYNLKSFFFTGMLTPPSCTLNDKMDKIDIIRN